MPFYILCNPAGETYTLANITPEYAAEHESSNSGACVLFDPVRHIDWCPGDVHDGRGGFTTPALTPERRAEVRDTLDTAIAAIKTSLRAEALVADDPTTASAEVGAIAAEIVKDAAIQAGAQKDEADPEGYLQMQINAAVTHHDLPAIVRPICADRAFAQKRVAEATEKMMGAEPAVR